MFEINFSNHIKFIYLETFVNETLWMISNKTLLSNMYVFLRSDEWKNAVMRHLCSYSYRVWSTKTKLSKQRWYKTAFLSPIQYICAFKTSTWVCNTVKIIPEFYGAVFLTHLAIVFLFHCYLHCLKLPSTNAYCYRRI